MTQFARPTSTLAATGWIAVGAASIHAALGTVAVSDASLARSDTVQGSTFTVGLSGVTNPGQGTVTLRYRVRRSVANRNYTLQVDLYQGASLIQSFSTTNPDTTFATYTQTITNRAEITDWSNLRLVFTSSTIQASAVFGEVSWAEIETPVAAVPVPVTIPAAPANASTVGLQGGMFGHRGIELRTVVAAASADALDATLAAGRAVHLVAAPASCQASALGAELVASASPAWVHDALVTDVPGTRYVDEDLEPGTWYRYRLRSTADGRESEWSDWHQVATDASTPVVLQATTAQSVAEGLAATATTQRVARLAGELATADAEGLAATATTRAATSLVASVATADAEGLIGRVSSDASVRLGASVAHAGASGVPAGLVAQRVTALRAEVAEAGAEGRAGAITVAASASLQASVADAGADGVGASLVARASVLLGAGFAEAQADALAAQARVAAGLVLEATIGDATAEGRQARFGVFEAERLPGLFDEWSRATPFDDWRMGMRFDELYGRDAPFTKTTRQAYYDEPIAQLRVFHETDPREHFARSNQVRVFPIHTRPGRFELDERGGWFFDAIFARKEETMELEIVNFGPYTVNEIPEPLYVRVHETMRDGSTRPMTIHGQIPEWKAHVSIEDPSGTTVSERAADILDPSALDADHFPTPEEGWIKVEWADGDFTIPGAHAVQLTLSNEVAGGNLRLKSTAIYKPNVNVGPAANVVTTP